MTVKGVVQGCCPVDKIQVSVMECMKIMLTLTVPNIQYPPLSSASKSVTCYRRLLDLEKSLFRENPLDHLNRGWAGVG